MGLRWTHYGHFRFLIMVLTGTQDADSDQTLPRSRTRRNVRRRVFRDLYGPQLRRLTMYDDIKVGRNRTGRQEETGHKPVS